MWPPVNYQQELQNRLAHYIVACDEEKQVEPAGVPAAPKKGPSQVIALVKCECPGRSLAPNMGMAIKLSEMKPDSIYLSSCLVNAEPNCPYTSAEELAKILENKTGIKVVSGTHDYHW